MVLDFQDWSTLRGETCRRQSVDVSWEDSEVTLSVIMYRVLAPLGRGEEAGVRICVYAFCPF
jgi:hypothetical protein